MSTSFLRNSHKLVEMIDDALTSMHSGLVLSGNELTEAAHAVAVVLLLTSFCWMLHKRARRMIRWGKRWLARRRDAALAEKLEAESETPVDPAE